MTVKILQLVAIAVCLWCYIDLRKKMNKKWMILYEEIWRQLSRPDRIDRQSANFIAFLISDLHIMAFTRRQRKLVGIVRQTWTEKFNHLFSTPEPEDTQTT